MKNFLILFAVAAGLVAFSIPSTNINSSADALTVGDTAPDFSLKNIDGRIVSLEGLAKDNDIKGYILTFTCNTCPFAVMYEDRLVELHNRFAPQGWPVVAINPNDPDVKPGDSFSAMKDRATEKGFPFSYLFDDGQQVYPQYGATKTPHVFLLDITRKVRYIGAIDNNAQDAAAATEHYVADAIAAVEAGKNPDPSYTKAVGCSIKVKK